MAEITDSSKGMDIARDFYDTCGKKMIKEKFPEYESRIAVGLVGEGSECFGFDDEYSRDHDFGAGFCMWLSEDDLSEIGQDLQAAYDEIGNEYKGYEVKKDSALGGHRIGVFGTKEFYMRFLGSDVIPSSMMAWLSIPDSYFAVATNGEVFRDDLGVFSEIRERLLTGRPEDVRIKKMIARMAEMSRSGQYNFMRCVRRGEMAAAHIELSDFMRSGMQLIYLMNKKYAPYDKWLCRGMENLEILGSLRESFTMLADGKKDPEEKSSIIDSICGSVAAELHSEGLIDSDEPFLQAHLPRMQENIEDGDIRSLPWLYG